MKGFKLNDKGDIIINNDILFVEDEELTKQTIQTLLKTNKGEWWFNPNEGINFNNLLVKNPNYDVIKAEIISGILQVDESIQLQDFKYSLEKETRKLKIDFSAKKQNGIKITCYYNY